MMLVYLSKKIRVNMFVPGTLSFLNSRNKIFHRLGPLFEPIQP